MTDKDAETPRQFSYRLIIGQYSRDTKITEFNRVYDLLEQKESELTALKAQFEKDVRIQALMRERKKRDEVEARLAEVEKEREELKISGDHQWRKRVEAEKEANELTDKLDKLETQLTEAITKAQSLEVALDVVEKERQSLKTKLTESASRAEKAEGVASEYRKALEAISENGPEMPPQGFTRGMIAGPAWEKGYKKGKESAGYRARKALAEAELRRAKGEKK